MQRPEPPLRLVISAGLMLLLCVACSATPARTSAGPRVLTLEGRANLGLAENYLAQKQTARALEYAQKAEGSDPNSANVQLMLAMVYQAAGDERKAERSLDKAMKLAPTAGAVLNVHGAWLCEHGHPDQADAEFVRAMRDRNYQDPMQILSNAGKCALQAKRLERAEGYFRQALESAPEDQQLLYLLAETEFRQGKLLEARAFAQRRDALGADAATLALSSRIEEAAGDQMAAARYRQRLHEQFPDYLPTAEGPKAP